jgi:hypothetical protein
MEAHRPVRLTIPAEPDSVRLARLVAAGVAADAGLSIDDTEDLRIAVSELVALLIDGPATPDTDATITYRRTEGEVEVSGEYHAGADAAEGALDDLVLEILRVVIDDHDFRVEGDVRRFRLVKRARTLA